MRAADAWVRNAAARRVPPSPAVTAPRPRYVACTASPVVRSRLLPLVAPLLTIAACGSGLPSPPKGSPKEDSFIEVPFPPPPARLERVPDRPPGRAVWVDGSWEWTGTRWRWKEGGWFEAPPPGVVYSDWRTARPGGKRLLFADATWRDRSGAEVPAPRLLVSATLSVPDEGEVDAGSPPDAGPDAGAEGSGQ
jgi:hypothetical protein